MKIIYSVFTAFVLLVLVAACSSEDLYDLDAINSQVKKTEENQRIDQDVKNSGIYNEGNDDHNCGGPP